MRVVRGARSNADADRRLTRQLTRFADRADETTIRVWTPPKQVAFGRRDSMASGYEDARQIALEHGYEPVERRVGGTAVAYTGQTIAFAVADPTSSGRDGIDSRYRETLARLTDALEATGAAVDRGEPPESFCSGAYSIQGPTGKIAGIAQRVRRRATLVGGCVVAVTTEERLIPAVLDPVYTALETPFDPGSVGSVESAGGPADPARVIEAIELVFTDESDTTVHRATELSVQDAP